MTKRGATETSKDCLFLLLISLFLPRGKFKILVRDLNKNTSRLCGLNQNIHSNNKMTVGSKFSLLTHLRFCYHILSLKKYFSSCSYIKYIVLVLSAFYHILILETLIEATFVVIFAS